MPWNEQKGGGSGGGGDSPWGRPSRPTGGGGSPGGRPDLEESLRRMQERFRRRGGGGNGAGGGGSRGGRGLGAMGLGVLFGLLFIGWLLTGIYQVSEQEQAVVLRFGKIHRTVGPGFQIRLPNPIEEHFKVRVNVQNETPIGVNDEESLMLTGDENIVDIDFSINWKINVARNYLFNITDPLELIKQVGESAMREVVGTSQFEPITTGERTGVEARVRDLMQQTLNTYDAGIEITSISLKDARPPEEVIAAQRDVSSAEQDRATSINQATAYANDVVPKAKGQAQQAIQQAEAYRDASIANASGEAERFRLVYEQYQKAPRVTRERMFLETMESVIGRSDKIIIDGKGGTVPILPLDQLRGRTTQTERAQ